MFYIWDVFTTTSPRPLCVTVKKKRITIAYMQFFPAIFVIGSNFVLITKNQKLLVDKDLSYGLTQNSCGEQIDH